jgi:lipoprotein-anchoring transpeptidase ErfK/SrfK
VQVTANGTAVQGELTADGTSWRSRWPLTPGRTYAVWVTSTADGGKTTTATSRFSTAAAGQTVSASVTGLQDGETVGVGMPIMLNFSGPVYNKAEIERTLEVQASIPVEGAWHWFGAQQVIFRPKTYWPTGEHVTVIAHLNGARPAKGVYSTKDLRLSFKVGDALVSTVDTKKHTMTVRRGGTVLRTIPMSAGRATERRFTTTNGIHVISEKLSPVIFDSATVGIPKGAPGYYKIVGYFAARISDSGEFVHSAPWSVADQGKRNVSHGCVNQAPANAKRL